MGGRRRGNDGDFERDQGRPVDPEEARAHGNDPDAVEVRHEGGRGEVGRSGIRREEGQGAGEGEEEKVRGASKAERGESEENRSPGSGPMGTDHDSAPGGPMGTEDKTEEEAGSRVGEEEND